jgi:hypothetical protein
VNRARRIRDSLELGEVRLEIVYEPGGMGSRFLPLISTDKH